MFNISQIADTVRSFSEKTGIVSSELRVGSSGALVMLGLKNESRDIDVEVSTEVFENLKKRFPDAYRPKPYFEGHPLAPGVLELLVFDTEHGDLEIMLASLPFESPTQVTRGITHHTKETAVKFKQWLSREKDVQHLKEAGLI